MSNLQRRVGSFDLFHARVPFERAGGEPDGTGRLPFAAVGVVSARHREFSGDVLRIDAEGAEAAASGAVLLKATAGGQDVFEVKVSSGLRSRTVSVVDAAALTLIVVMLS